MLREAQVEQARKRHYQPPEPAIVGNSAKERPSLLDCTGPEPRFHVYRFDADTGASEWMVAWASELTEAEIADLSAEERDLVQASLAVDDPTIGAVHNGEPRVETLAECMEAASAAE